MIRINATGIEDVVGKAFIELYNSKTIVSDPAVWKEDVAVFEIDYLEKPPRWFDIVDKKLKYNFPHSNYFPAFSKDRIEVEIDYWTKVIAKPDVAGIIINHLKEHPYSRRAIIDLWREEFINNLDKGAACVTQMYFRRKGDTIEFHAHTRANDVYNCLLMDLHIMSSLHQWITEGLGLKLGKFIYFVDALHFYKKDIPNIDTQLKHIIKSDLWQKI